jgi:hypothetical protein
MRTVIDSSEEHASFIFWVKGIQFSWTQEMEWQLPCKADDKVS